MRNRTIITVFSIVLALTLLPTVSYARKANTIIVGVGLGEAAPQPNELAPGANLEIASFYVHAPINGEIETIKGTVKIDDRNNGVTAVGDNVYVVIRTCIESNCTTTSASDIAVVKENNNVRIVDFTMPSPFLVSSGSTTTLSVYGTILDTVPIKATLRAHLTDLTVTNAGAK
ncbi:hypothetical protein COV04_03575 [Candidatus Uhrbacteria bacterium CG10_big_fil_rev_8_21_14_0_10_48_11]|uniref:Uncharacterized protein n=1 Tax=Candidatus Uhrbacteria bacterium CG10_big_fil_rev_8_21_14_0_10_48_11 TaxID=1975037 RepID=A0A2M8LDX8_9BACT|nr:MAG: hypothetical protein COV04_03575 [Candidatus Uhrbacteria bacterium CG10_big_fil_rev_8_21_14_0_10_48_11]